MKYFYLILFTASLISSGTVAQAGHSDSVRLKKAGTALLNNKCDEALSYLQDVSIEGKEKAGYLLLMGEMQECKTNMDQAIYFYEKYAAINLADEKIKVRIQKLKAGLEQNEGHRNNKLNSRGNNIHEIYYLLDGGLSFAAGGKENTNYNYEWQLALATGKPVFHKHAVLELAVQGGQMVLPNKEWFANVLNTPIADVNKVGNALTFDLSAALMVMIMNTKTQSLVVGPAAGLKLFATLNHDISYQGPDCQDNEHWAWVSPVIGIKARYLYRQKFTVFAAYDKITRTGFDVYNIDNTGLRSVLYKAPLHMGLLTISGGIFIDN